MNNRKLTVNCNHEPDNIGRFFTKTTIGVPFYVAKGDIRYNAYCETCARKMESHCNRDPSPVGACAGPGRCSCECPTCHCPLCDQNPCTCDRSKWDMR